MNFTNARIYRNDFEFHDGSFTVADGRFASSADGRFASSSAAGETIDLKGKQVVPGLVDIHFHGNSGHDFSDGQYEGLLTIARYLAKNGITSFSPASMTLPEGEISAAFATAIQLRDTKPEKASVIRGITMEGPFFNAAKKGAQKADHLRAPDYDFFKRLNKQADGMVKIVCVAPELPGALPFIEQASKEATVAIAHTTADYDQAAAGFKAGASHVTHLYNAMPPFAHRAPGVIGAAADQSEATVELITDGIHLHPSVVRASFKLFGAGQVVLVSDSMMACGMSDGKYNLGGQDVFVTGNTAKLADGTIAGSATNLLDCLRTAIKFGVRPEAAIRAATLNPACVIGADGEIGSIEDGKIADFIVFNDDWSVDAIYLAGKKLV